MAQDQASSAAEHRPKLWRFYRELDLKAYEVAEQLGRSREWLRQITLPFGHPDRVTPSPDDVALIFTWSNGAIVPGDWYPPNLSAANINGLPEDLAS